MKRRRKNIRANKEPLLLYVMPITLAMIVGISVNYDDIIEKMLIFGHTIAMMMVAHQKQPENH